MKEIKARFNGKDYVLPANNSGWISTSEKALPEGITAAFLREKDRVGTGPKGEPIIADDTGKKIHLGGADFRRADEKIHQCSSGGTGTGSAAIKGLREKCQVLADEISKMKDVPASVTEALAALELLCKEHSAIELKEGDNVFQILVDHPKVTLQKLMELAEKEGLVINGQVLAKKEDLVTLNNGQTVDKSKAVVHKKNEK